MFLGIAILNIVARNVALTANENVRDVVILPDKFKANGVYLQSQALNYNWQPVDNHLYINIDTNTGLTIRSNTALSNNIIVDTFYISQGSWWIS